MLKIAICEDVQEFADMLEQNLQTWSVTAGVNVSIRKFDNGYPLLYCIHDSGTFDLIFMDVEMEKMNGLEAAEKIREEDYLTTFIFVSQYEDYYKEAYHVHPFHFLSKPVSQAKVNEVMGAYLKMKKQDVETITFSVNKARYTVPLLDILYFASERRRINVVCKDRIYQFYGKLIEIQNYVQEKNFKFIRIHQSFLVNMKYIKEYRYSDLTVSNGDILPISKDNKKKIRELHKMMLEKEF